MLKIEFWDILGNYDSVEFVDWSDFLDTEVPDLYFDCTWIVRFM